ncbi:unnamed protein product [Oikopleura dioica]|uniref:C2H2-type domain-containing protein n=1 Tax=Oikopleura dioica TaxID=34765 RepID=E4XRN0_OIKDI|nr:unnamed protein product [Oikopleura dioica]
MTGFSMDKNTIDQKLKMTESLKKYLIKNGYTKTLAVLEKERVFKTPPRRSARLSFAILKAPKRVALTEIPEKSKKKTKKTNLETEKVKVPDAFKQLALKFGLPGEHLDFFYENREKFSWEHKKKMVVRCSGNNCHCKFTAEVKPGSLVDHMIEFHEFGEFPCQETDCNFTGYSTHSLKHHLNKFHGTAKRASSAEQKHRCKYASCSYIAPTTSALESHHRVHENRSIKCEFCHYRAFQAHIMYEHMMSQGFLFVQILKFSRPKTGRAFKNFARTDERTMRSISPFCKDNKIFMWVRETCLTIDHDGVTNFLPNMNYLTSYLVCQLREAKVVTLKNTEVAVVFMLRNISAITSSINRLVPPYALDQVVVSLPESKEFILLNGSELEGSEVFTKFQDYAYLPSGLIEILPKPFEFNPPFSNKSWPEFWKHICSKTTDLSRRSYCASFASSSPSNDNDEENLKTVLNISELNKVALLNLLKSGKVINCVSKEDIRNYSLRPRPDNEESAISTAAESGDRVILPGQCSYILMWKGRRSIYRRNYNLEPRAENRQFYNNKQATSISTNYLCEADLLTLASNDRNKTIDDAPVGIIEIPGLRIRAKIFGFPDRRPTRD